MKSVRWGILGCGDVTEVKSGPGFQRASGSELVAVMRRNGALAQDYARRHGVARWYDDAAKLIEDPGVDAVYVATPPAFHREYTLMAARAGKPVYVEKPMARRYVECAEMVEACRQAGVPLFVAYYRRTLEPFVQIKGLIDKGVLGEIRSVTVVLTRPAAPAAEIPWRVKPELSGGGLFFDLASHTLDLLDFLLGPIEKASGYPANQARLHTAEDIVAASFSFASGVQGAGLWSFSSFDEGDEVVITGTKGRVSFSCFGFEPAVLTTAAGTTPLAFERPVHVQQPLIQTIVDELRGLGTCPSTGESGARTNWVMDEIFSGWPRG